MQINQPVNVHDIITNIKTGKLYNIKIIHDQKSCTDMHHIAAVPQVMSETRLFIKLKVHIATCVKITVHWTIITL